MSGAEQMAWLHEAVTARNRYAMGARYKEYPLPPAKGWCARCARVLFREVTGKALPYAQRDADHDGDVDALDMLRLERVAGHVVRYVAGMPLKCGWRLYWTRGRNGHVATVVGESPQKVLENTTATRKVLGTHIGPGTIITPVSCMPRPAYVGTYTGDDE